MNRLTLLMAVALFFTTGCATIMEASRVADFEEVSKAYERAMLDSDFETAHGFTDPEIVPEVDFALYEDFKVVEYKVKKGKMSNAKTEVNETVEVKYYRVDRLVVETVRYGQLWKYDSVKKTWILKTGLPEFK